MHELADPDLIWQQCLFAFEEPSIDATFAQVTRTWLDDDSWIDHAPLWLHGADRIFGELIAVLPWQQREVTMYDRRLPEPRLTAWSAAAAPTVETVPVLGDACAALSRHYSRPFDSIGFNLYRDGHDSVAWHSDRERFRLEDPTVAIVSTGQPRSFQVRPIGGGPSHSWQLGHGDLIVMGGSCQHYWQHCVPKVAAAGPRLSIMFRHNMADAQVRDCGGERLEISVRPECVRAADHRWWRGLLADLRRRPAHSRRCGWCCRGQHRLGTQRGGRRHAGGNGHRCVFGADLAE